MPTVKARDRYDPLQKTSLNKNCRAELMGAIVLSPANPNPFMVPHNAKHKNRNGGTSKKLLTESVCQRVTLMENF